MEVTEHLRAKRRGAPRLPVLAVLVDLGVLNAFASCPLPAL